jgi:hypothetical protein
VLVGVEGVAGSDDRTCIAVGFRPSSLRFQLSTAVALATTAAASNKGAPATSSTGMDREPRSSDRGRRGGGAVFDADFCPRSPPSRRRSLWRRSWSLRGCTRAGLACCRPWRQRRRTLKLTWIRAGQVDAGWRTCLSPSAAASGVCSSSTWRWPRGSAPADAPQSHRLRRRRAFLEVHKAAGQRGGRARFGFGGSSPSLLPVVAPATSETGSERWLLHKGSQGPLCNFVLFRVSLCKCVWTAGFPVSSLVRVRVLYDLL